MSSNPQIVDPLRQAILNQPDVILDDKDLMNALVGANERTMGANIVDLRGIAMEKLERRLDRLEDTHRSVIAAAYENLAGSNQVNRAILRMLDAVDFDAFLATLGGDVADILRVDAIKLVLESSGSSTDPALQNVAHILGITAPGSIAAYVHAGNGAPRRQVILRGLQHGAPEVYGEKADWIRSEACLMLDFGPGCLPGMLVLGAEDPHMFSPQQGTDLLTFFAGVFERTMRRWLA
ncbi:MAG: DUF484 family protein [Pseudomonadota bacterium]